MRLRRSAVTVALAALPLVAVATPAHAVTCNLLVDFAGDGTWNLAPISSDQLDILSGDVASGPTTVVAVLRMKGLIDNAYSNLGPSWAFGWQIDGGWYSVELRRGAGPNPSYISVFTSPTSAISVPFSYDLGTGVIGWTIPRSAMPVLATPGRVFERFAANTKLLSSTADQTFSTTTSYVDQSPSCVSAA